MRQYISLRMPLSDKRRVSPTGHTPSLAGSGTPGQIHVLRQAQDVAGNR
jgi:hypothetical protein